MLAKFLDKDNLHHAYLIEGLREMVVPEILTVIKNLGIEVLNNPDFCQISIDSFKMDDALSLRQMGSERSFTTGKKFFVVSVNSFTLDAQQALLKIFEEPIENTHFFVVVPEVDALIKTLISRFYVIKNLDQNVDLKDAEKFVAMPKIKRIDFLKELMKDEDDDSIGVDGARAKSLRFLNELEIVLYKGLRDSNSLLSGADCFKQIFKAREFLRQPGSATKTLMESVALSVPFLN